MSELEPNLQELAVALAADAPVPRPEFAEQLRKRVEAGFPKPTRAHRRARHGRGGRSPVGAFAHDFAPLLGLAATVLVIATVVVVAGRGSNSDSSALSSGGDAGGGGGSVAAESAPDSAPAKGFAPQQLDRSIERTYSLDLGVKADEMSRVADRVTAIAYRHGGFVLSSSLDTGEGGGNGDFSLRIPTAQLRPALRDLSALAPVTSQSQTGRDVTRQHVTAKDRLRSARAERRSLLRRLETATTNEEADALRRRLDIVAGEINGLRSQLRDLRLRTNYAVVNVTLSEAKQSDGGGIGSFGNSLDDAGKLLVGFAGVTIVVLALALPLGLIALLGWLIGRALIRRRRESALA